MSTAGFEPKYRDLSTLLNVSLKDNASRPLFGTKKNGVWTWMTYGEFGTKVDQCRAGLVALGVKMNDRVVVISNNRVEWAIGAYACYGIGAAYVPMYEAQLPKEWKFIINDCTAKIVLAATRDITTKVNGMCGELPSIERVICLDGDESEADSFATLIATGAKTPVPAIAPEPNAIASLIYTSGTTGQPKGVMLSHSNLAMNVSASLATFVITKDDQSLSFLPWAHVFGQTGELHMLIGAGGSMAICEGIPKIIDNLAEIKPTILMAVPNIFNRIYDSVQTKMRGESKPIQWIFHTGFRAANKARKGEPVSFLENIALKLAKKLIFPKVVARFGGRLKYSISGGAALSREVGEFIDTLGINVYEGYGLTETSPVICVTTPKNRKIGTTGLAIPGVVVKLDHDASGSQEEGEIIVYGHNVMLGYYNLPEETKKVFTEDGGFRTGDLGKFTTEGYLQITGRIKELYKMENGKYVAPVAIESKMQLSPYILQSMMFGANKPFNIAVIVPKMESLKSWATENGIDTSDVTKMLSHDAVRGLLKAEIDQAASPKGYESIKNFIVLAEEFTVNNDLLTPKLSMKRRNVVQRYEKEIEALYTAAKK